MLSLPFTVGALLAGAVIAWPRAGPSSKRRRRLARDRRPAALARPGPAASAGSSGGDEGAGRRPALVRRVRRLRGRGPASARGAALEREVLGLVEGLAAILRAGLPPAQAMHHLASGALEVGGATAGGSAVAEIRALVALLADRAASGAHLEPAWRGAADRLASPALTAVTEGWGLSERHGAPVVPVLDALVAALRDDARVAAAIESSLAAPRATAALLGMLPLGGVLLGEVVGVHPIAVLVGTGIGRIALCTGLMATVGGRLWMARLVRAAQER